MYIFLKIIDVAVSKRAVAAFLGELKMR